MTTDELLTLLREMKLLRNVLARLDNRLRRLDVMLAPASGSRRHVTYEQVLAALDSRKGNVTKAARLLQIHRKQLQRLMIAYELRDAEPPLYPVRLPCPRSPANRSWRPSTTRRATCPMRPNYS